MLQSPSVVCLRLCLMVATWFEFSKWLVLLPDVNTPVSLLLQRAHFCGRETKQTSTCRRSDEALEKSRSFEFFLEDYNKFCMLVQTFKRDDYRLHWCKNLFYNISFVGSDLAFTENDMNCECNNFFLVFKCLLLSYCLYEIVQTIF